MYNFDETALFYRMEPDSTLATIRIEGKKKTKRELLWGCALILHEVTN